MLTRPFVLRSLITAALFSTAHLASAGIMSYTPFSGDADSGINSGLTYTAKADFLGPEGGRTVNGVTFSDTALDGTGYSLTGPTNQLTGSGNLVGGEVGGMLTDFFFGPGDGNATLTLTGLTVGTEYVTTWYNRGFGAPGGRLAFITASDTPDGRFRIDQNSSGEGNGNVIRYTFTATSTTQTYLIDAINNADTFHHYAFSNAIRNDALLPLVGAPVAPRVSSQTAENAGEPVTPAGVSSTDLLQTQLSSAVLTGGEDPEGLGGVGALTDGAFTAGAGNQAYFTPLAGSSVTFNLDITTNARGYDISSVRGFGGWNDNGRDLQNYSLYYSVVGESEFRFLGTVAFEPGIAGGLASTVTSIFDTSLTGVNAIRVDFLAPQENGHVGYGEFDLIGVATVPEPSTMLLLLSAIPLLQRRRRSTSAA